MRTHLIPACLGLILALGGPVGAAEPAKPPAESAPAPAPPADASPAPPPPTGKAARYYPDYDLQTCRLFHLAGRGLHEFCAVSQPTKAGPRRFLLTVRDPARLEKKGGAKGVVVASLVVPAAAGEYLDYRRAGLYPIVPGWHLAFIPLVSPVPEQVQRARALFYLYGEAEQRFSPLWEPAPCAAPCEEEVQLSLPDNNGALLEYTQIIGGARTTQSHVIPFAAPPPAAQ